VRSPGIGVPYNLAVLIDTGPNGLHPVVDNLLWPRASLPESGLVHPQQYSQRLVGRGFNHRHAAVTQREG
jgi:hypothetical protein